LVKTASGGQLGDVNILRCSFTSVEPDFKAESLRAIAAGLDERGIPAARGGGWSAVQVARLEGWPPFRRESSFANESGAIFLSHGGPPQPSSSVGNWFIR